MKTVLRIVAVLVLLAAAAAGWAGYEAWTFLKTPPATPGQEAFFDVEPGANVRRVADKLEERGLITDARKFLLLARSRSPGCTKSLLHLATVQPQEVVNLEIRTVFLLTLQYLK